MSRISSSIRHLTAGFGDDDGGCDNHENQAAFDRRYFAYHDDGASQHHRVEPDA